MWIVVALLVIVAVAGGILASRLESKRLPKKRKRFESRECLSVSDIYDRFYAASGYTKQSVSTIWNEVAEILMLDPGKLRPHDRFDDELRPVPGHLVEDELADLNEWLRLESKRKGLRLDRVSLTTLDDLVRLLAEREGSKCL